MNSQFLPEVIMEPIDPRTLRPLLIYCITVALIGAAVLWWYVL